MNFRNNSIIFMQSVENTVLIMKLINGHLDCQLKYKINIFISVESMRSFYLSLRLDLFDLGIISSRFESSYNRRDHYF